MSPKHRNESEERVFQLLAALERASATQPLTQAEIVKTLVIDDPSDRKNQRSKLAYSGSDTAVRQKFERDKATIRSRGYHIATVRIDDVDGYFIPSHTSSLMFDADEYRALGQAITFCNFGEAGASRVFAEDPRLTGGMNFMSQSQSLLVAIRRRVVVRFTYFKDAKPREVEPLLLRVRYGVTYLVARDAGTTNDPKIFRLDRIVDTPELTSTVFKVTGADLEKAKLKKPDFGQTEPIKIEVKVSAAAAGLIIQRTSEAKVLEERGDDLVLELTFSNLADIRTFLIHHASQAVLLGPDDVRESIRASLLKVNNGDPIDVSGLTFKERVEKSPLDTTVRIVQAVAQSPDGLRVSEVAERFGLSVEDAGEILERLSTAQPMFGKVFKVEDGYPANIRRAYEDEYEDDESGDQTIGEAESESSAPNLDPLYIPDEAYGGTQRVDLSRLSLQDIIELYVAATEAQRLMPNDTALNSAIEKLAGELDNQVVVDVSTQLWEPVLRDAIDNHQAVTIGYTKPADNSVESRTIVPTEMLVQNGRTMLRAYCLTRKDWREFRVDRMHWVENPEVAPEIPADPHADDWLELPGMRGDEVVVVMTSFQRYLFEGFPLIKWAECPDGRWAAKFRVNSESWLDEQLLLAGDGAVVAAGPDNLKQAGHALAKKMVKALAKKKAKKMAEKMVKKRK